MSRKHSDAGIELPLGALLFAVITLGAAVAAFDIGGVRSHFGGVAIAVTVCAVGALVVVAGLWFIYRPPPRVLVRLGLFYAAGFIAIIGSERAADALSAQLEPGTLRSVIKVFLEGLALGALIGASIWITDKHIVRAASPEDT